MTGHESTDETVVEADTDVSYRLRVNGTDHDVAAAWLGESLLYVLRERLGLPGSKNACEQGECGSCSVFVDGLLVCSCLVLGAAAVDRTIVTVEGVGDESGAPSLVQRAFVDAGAVQCGFCTPGLVMTVHDLLHRSRVASELEIREAISGNLCRCTGYGRILDAIERAFAAADEGQP
jgi:carbon-monoxide dehydrogenase small subunit